MTVRILPPMPIFDLLVKKYGYSEFKKRFIDKDGNVKENAPKGLKEETERARKEIQ